MRRHGPVIAHCTDSEDFPLQRWQDKVGVPAEVWQDIVRYVFGAEGLAGGRFRTTLDASDAFRTLFSMTGHALYWQRCEHPKIRRAI